MLCYVICGVLVMNSIAIQAASVIVTSTAPNTSVLNLDVFGSRWWSTDNVTPTSCDDFKFPETSTNGNDLAFIQVIV
jgi:hypothetical protein